MRELVSDKGLVANCGLYCGACKAYLKERCPGCHDNAKASWCKIRTCCGEHNWATCADCTDFPDPKQCPKFDNLIARVIGVVLNSDRRACVLKVRELGADGFAAFMAGQKRQTLPRRGA